jgi:hypothetical protein
MHWIHLYRAERASPKRFKPLIGKLLVQNDPALAHAAYGRIMESPFLDLDFKVNLAMIRVGRAMMGPGSLRFHLTNQLRF